MRGPGDLKEGVSMSDSDRPRRVCLYKGKVIYELTGWYGIAFTCQKFDTVDEAKQWIDEQEGKV